MSRARNEIGCQARHDSQTTDPTEQILEPRKDQVCTDLMTDQRVVIETFCAPGLTIAKSCVARCDAAWCALESNWTKTEVAEWWPDARCNQDQ